MSRSFLSQLLQISGSATYDDTIGSPHTVGVAEAQTDIEGDLNVVRTLMKDMLGTTNWYDSADMSMQGIAQKYFIELLAPAGFTTGVAITAASSTLAFDAAIKTITGHANGAGSSIAGGVIVTGTKEYHIEVREHATQNPFDDGSNNEVYGKLTWTGTQYLISWYSFKAGVETAYTFATTPTVDISAVAVSRRYEDMDWGIFMKNGWHDVAGPVGSVSDASVTTGPWTYLLNGATTAQQAFQILDDLGNTAPGEGASGIAFDNAATGTNGYYTGTNLQTALEELLTQIGGTTSTTYAFTGGAGTLLTDNMSIYPALDALDQGWVNLLLAGTASAGANLVGIQDAGGYYPTLTTVEQALQNIGSQLADVSVQKASEILGSSIPSGTAHTIAGSLSYTPDGLNPGANMDVYFNGQLLLAGADTITTNDYQEGATGGLRTQIKFNFTVPSGKTLTYMVRK